MNRIGMTIAAVLMSPLLATAAHAASADTVRVVTTAQQGPRLQETGTVTLAAGHALTEAQTSVFIDPQRRFQTVLGIGGAITDSSADVFAQLPAARQAELIKAYYDPVDGLGYSLLRTTIHSTDFSTASYTYIAEGDGALASFDIAPDRRARMPMIKRAIAQAGGSITTFASPWSAPAFMKSNRSMLKGGSLLPEYAPAWANYFAKFIKAYEQEGIPIWGVSLQNEPMAVQTWESMIYSAEEERDFLKLHLGPTLEKAGLGDKRIIVWDHNRDMMAYRAQVIFGDPEAAKYAWGMGFHWYETWAGGEPMFGNVAAVTQAFPDKPVLLTEAAVEKFDPARYQYWPNAERYGRAMINDLNGGAVGWTDWNILLDQHGGPNHVGNWCFAPVHADTTTGELIYTPSYHYIGHFSRYIRPGAQRVSSAPSRSTLLATAFRNEDGGLVTVVMNPTGAAIDYNYYVGDRSAVVTIPAHAIQTLLRAGKEH